MAGGERSYATRVRPARAIAAKIRQRGDSGLQRRHDRRQPLEALAAQQNRDHCEVVIVDNGLTQRHRGPGRLG
jgi:hypothetical protein